MNVGNPRETEYQNRLPQVGTLKTRMVCVTLVRLGKANLG